MIEYCHDQISAIAVISWWCFVNHSLQLLYETSSVCSELIYPRLCRSARTSASICRSLQDIVANEFVPAWPAVPSMSCSSCLNHLWDGRQITVGKWTNRLTSIFSKIREVLQFWKFYFFFEFLAVLALKFVGPIHSMGKFWEKLKRFLILKKLNKKWKRK